MPRPGRHGRNREQWNTHASYRSRRAHEKRPGRPTGKLRQSPRRSGDRSDQPPAIQTERRSFFFHFPDKSWLSKPDRGAPTPACSVHTFQKPRGQAKCIANQRGIFALHGNTLLRRGKKNEVSAARDAPEGTVFRSCERASARVASAPKPG